MAHQPPGNSTGTSDSRRPDASLTKDHELLFRHQRDDEISILDIAVVLAKHKRAIVGFPLLAAGVATVVSLLMTPVYTATTKIISPQQPQSTAAAMLGQLGALAGGAGGALGIKNPADLYVSMLKSRTVADGLIETFGLMKRYDKKLISDARKLLESNSKISAGKDGLITIEVDDTDPKSAAALANGYTDQLMKLTSVLAVTEAGQRRLFFEKQLLAAKSDLLQAETLARRALNQGGIAMVDAQGKSLLEMSASLRAQIAAKEVQIGAMKTFAAGQHPEYLKAINELSALKHQISKMEGTVATGKTAEKIDTGERGLNNLALLRDVKYYEMLFDVLAKQYELAKIDEAKEGAVIQVLDKASEPERKSKPKRFFIVVLVAFVAGVFAVVWAFVSEARHRALNDPKQAERLAVLKRYL